MSGIKKVPLQHILSSVVPSISPRSSPPAGTGTDETFTEYKHYLVTQVVRKDWFNNFIDNFRDGTLPSYQFYCLLELTVSHTVYELFLEDSLRTQLISYAARKSPVQEFFL